MKHVMISLLALNISMQATTITIANKSSNQIIVSVRTAEPNKQLMKPRQSKKFSVQLSEQQPLIVQVEHAAAYWPSSFELKLMAPGQVVIKRDSLVLSTKFSKKRALSDAPLKIAYYGKPGLGGQEIGFL
jgi:hypothetical protein